MEDEQDECVAKRIVIGVVRFLSLPTHETEYLDVEDGEDEEQNEPQGEDVQDRWETRSDEK